MIAVLPHNPAPETWLPVVGYEGLYEVSDLGRVRRVKDNRRSKAGFVLRQCPNGGGYPSVRLFSGTAASGTRWRVHVLVAAAFIGPRPHKWHIDHIDGDRTNSRLSNLEYVTHGENLRRGYAMRRARLPLPAGGSQ